MTPSQQRRAEERAAMHSGLMELNRAHLKKAGWKEIGTGRWVPKGIRGRKGESGKFDRYRTSWSFMAAIQTQMEMEMQQSAEEVFTDRKVVVNIA